MRTLSAFLLRWFALCLIANSFAADAQSLQLGEIEFPTSARSQAAQQHFVRGVAALHSFWYPVARDAFKQAQQIEPDFAMAYWGEAMTYNHPVWGDPQDTQAGRAAVARIDDSMTMSARERGYIDAVRVLFGEGDKSARDQAYAQAMRKLHERFPEDVEATLFYALALLGLGDEASRLQAGKIASSMFEAKPNHPGAAHYTIHAFDDPEHARLALSAARRYAEIAPDAPHALHMPSHIFVQLGLWQEAAQSNERSWAASVRWAKEHDAPGELDFHSLHWLLYAYLQQGRYDDAEALLGTMRQTLASLPKDDVQKLLYARYTQAVMAATWLIESQRWPRAEEVLGALAPVPDAAYDKLVNSPAIFARGIAAAHTGRVEAARAATETLRTLQPPPELAKVPYVAAIVGAARAQARMIDAVVTAERNDFAQALEIMQAVTDKLDIVPVGPPPLIKPPHELLGDIALEANRAERAQQAYQTALGRHENRARSLLGAARAAAASGDPDRAQRIRETLRRQWRGGEETLAALMHADAPVR